MSEAVMKSAALSASYNMVLQIAFRLGTFLLNAVVLRYISKDLLGVVNVRLMLLYSSTMFVAESFRRSTTTTTKEARNWAQTFNLLWFVVPVGALLVIVLSYFWMYQLVIPDMVSGYQAAVCIFALSAIVELISQPLNIAAQILLCVRAKVFIEGTAIAFRCLITVYLVIFQQHLGIFAFCISQLVYSTMISILYFAFFAYNIFYKKFPFASIKDVFPQHQKPFVDSTLAHLTVSFFKQTSLKQLLTEGERYVMTVWNVVSFAEQGIYDVVNNLGSMVARFIFLPLEDSGYMLFSNLLTRGQRAEAQVHIDKATLVLQALLRLVVIIGLIILTFGQSYASIALDIYGGSSLSSGPGPTLLRTHCVYVLLLALNGITECFSYATMTKEQVDRYNYKMLGFSFTFLAAALFLSQTLGCVGLILANCINMTLRIAHSLWHIYGYYKNTKYQPLKSLFPNWILICTLISVYFITSISEIYLNNSLASIVMKMLHLFVGAVSGLVVLVVIYVTEHPLIMFIVNQYRKKSD